MPSDPETTPEPLVVVGASGPINGLLEPDSGGAYVLITAVWHDGERIVMKISREAAEVLAAEINGVLHA